MLKVFAVHDVKAASYGNPLFMTTSGLAMRMFMDVCADPKSPMHQHPADYSLHELGTFDPNSGVIEGHEIMHIASASDMLQQLPVNTPKEVSVDE